MKNLIVLLFLCSLSLSAYSQSTADILDTYAETDNVSKMSLTGDVLRMFAKEYEQREIIDKIDKIDVYIFSQEKLLSKEDLSKIESNLKTTDYEELINMRDGDTKVKILVKEKGDTIKKLFMLMNSPETQSIVAEMKCNLTYDDLRKLELDVIGAEGLKYLSGNKGKKM